MRLVEGEGSDENGSLAYGNVGRRPYQSNSCHMRNLHSWSCCCAVGTVSGQGPHGPLVPVRPLTNCARLNLVPKNSTNLPRAGVGDIVYI